LVVVAGAIALVSAGKVLEEDGGVALVNVVGFAILVSALGVAALRWGTMDMADWRGIQAVIGPPLVVAPNSVAIGCGLAAGGGVLGTALWLRAPAGGRTILVLRIAEASIAGLALTTAFWGPGITPGETASAVALEAGRWAGLTVGTALIALLLGVVVRRWSTRVQAALLVLAAAAVGAGMVLVGGGV
jgi:hypothetical protein